MKLKIKIIFLTSYFLILQSIFSQVNYEPVSNSVYNFLERMSNKGIIQLNEEIKPFSRRYIARKIKIIHVSELKIKNEKLKIEKQRISGIEKEELEFYVREFAEELKRLGLDLSDYEGKKKLIDFKSDEYGFDEFNRLRLLSYSDDNFSLFADPILAFEYNNYSDGSSWSYSNGIKLYGNIGRNVGFDLQFYDNHPRGDNIDYKQNFSPNTGFEFKSGKDKGFDFDRMNVNLNFVWDYFTISIGKDFNYYGNGYGGKLLLSDKAPSFPNLKLEVYPVTWLKFSYIHGFLNSQILDSTTFRYNPTRNHISTVDKYFITHMISLTPFEFLNLAIGESVVYSDKFQPIYLIPFSFFRFSDHYLTDPDENAGNAQIFSSFWYKNYWLETKFYGSIFIDELSTSNLDYPQAIGYNFGFKTIDPIIPESELVVEYTRINPFVYSHADSAQTFASYGYELGHWIGSNADEIYLSFRKRFLRGLNLDVWYRYIRKGNEEDIANPRYQDDQTFLWGEKNYITMYGASLNYELIHSLYINAKYEYSKSEGENNYLLNPGSKFQFSISYGMGL